MSSIILVAETGSDISREVAEKYDIRIVPMHVNFDDVTTDDGSFPPQKIVDFYRENGRLPKTSGSTVGDFDVMFDQIHAEHPEAQILYLAYSAVTTCSCQSATISAEERDYVTIIDTRHVSAGQGAIVTELAKKLKANPDMTMDEAVAEANILIDRARMCFLPDNLEFLRAGGRVSNVAFLGSRILHIHPCIEILEGKLVATKKYRGKMAKVMTQLVNDYSESYNLDRACIWFVYTVGLTDEVRQAAKEAAEKCGFQSIEWVLANGVITTHGGPAAMGLAGFSRQ